MSSAQDTVEQYFQELLFDGGTGDSVDEEQSSESKASSPASTQTARTPEPNKSASEVAHQPDSPPKVKQPKSKAKSQTLGQDKKAAQVKKSAAAISVNPELRPSVVRKAELKPAALLSEPELHQDKKVELQKLLAPRTLTTKLKAPSKAPQPRPANPVAPPPQKDVIAPSPEPIKTPEPEALNEPPETPPLIEGRPEWAQEPFEALLFEVCGLTLAVPLVTLGQIVPLDKEALTSIFGQSDWFIGLLPSPIGRLRIVNTALFVMPEKYQDGFMDSAQYAISLDGVSWALAVDKVNQPIRLDPSEIKWRGSASRRPWLAGTVKSAMCALLDVPQMTALMNASDGKLASNQEETD